MIRLPDPNDYGPRLAQVAQLEAKRDQLTKRAEAVRTELLRAAAYDDDRFLVQQLQDEQKRIADQLPELALKIEAKRSLLPSEEEREAGRAEAEQVATQLPALGERLATGWAALVAALEAAADAAEVVVAARHERSQLAAVVSDLNARYGLEVRGGRPPELSGAKRARISAIFAQEALLGTPSDVVVRDLRALRAAEEEEVPA